MRGICLQLVVCLLGTVDNSQTSWKRIPRWHLKSPKLFKMMVVHITQDLMMSSTASSAARERGATFRFVKTATRALELIAENEVTHLLIDLQAPGLETIELGRSLSELDDERRPRSVAYAQHVHVGLLDAAGNSGFDAVMTRGQFYHNVSEILASS